MEASTSKTGIMFYEIAAEQSGVGKSNFDIPDSLLGPIVTSLDPCAINNLLYANIDWNIVENRLQIKKNIPKIEISSTSIFEGEENDNTSEGSRSNFGTPLYFSDKYLAKKSTPYRNSPHEEVIDINNFDQIQDNFNAKEKEKLIEDLVDLVRSIRKYKDPALSTSIVSWINPENISKISQQIVILLSYLPGILSSDELVHGFLFENGPEILKAILADLPEMRFSILKSLLKSFGHGKRNEMRMGVIENILQNDPSLAEIVIEKLSKNRFDTNFVCRVAVNHLEDVDFIKFLEPLLTDRQSFLSVLVTRSGGRKILPKIIEKLLKIVRNVMMAENVQESEISRPPWCTRLAYCLVELLMSSGETWKDDDMVLITRFVFRTGIEDFGVVGEAEEGRDRTNTEELMETGSFLSLTDLDDSIVADSEDESNNQPSKPILRRIRAENEPRLACSPFGDAHETFILASLVAVPFFTQFPPNQTAAAQPPDRAVDDWLDAARRRTIDWSHGTFGANLLYVHSCIMCGRIEDLAKFASEILRRKVEISQRNSMHAQVLKNTFLSRCLSEQEVANRSIGQAITPRFSEKSRGRSSIFSMAALQAAGVFRTYQINIADWIERQLQNVTFPASEILAEVVEVFASNTAAFKTPGLSLSFVESTFDNDNNGMLEQENLTQKLFVLLYLLSYREQYQKNEPSLKGIIYGEEVYTKLPLRYLLTVMETRHRDFENFRFRLISRAANIFPFTMPTAKSMALISKFTPATKNSPIKTKTSLKLELEFLERTSLENQVSAIPMVLDMFMETLKGDVEEKTLDIIVAMFEKYDQICPRLLYETAALKWLSSDESIQIEDLYKIPALLFRCDRRILNSPEHFQCFIKALNFFSVAVRSDLRLKMMMSNAKFMSLSQHQKQINENERKEKEHLTLSFIDSQHSVVIHALIEVCDEKRMKDDPMDFEMIEKRKRIARIACEYMHRVFIDFEGLLKVVLYQKFPIHQIRVLVEGIPSLFTANAYITEMLTLVDPQRRIFAVVLASELCRKYRVRETLETARIVCDFVHSLQKYGELPSSNQLWKHIVPAMITFATEFPSLTDCIGRLLSRVLANTRNRIAVRYGILAGDPKHEEYELIRTITTFFEKTQIVE
ncbi:unnamed protein product [Caenorhabditis angaria]|uniref:Uncharacterized protein n=1 Tax=Caenorhabditis angaria TaxID=860376 RepID=A0A9P1IV13_9PELO|nr:unnamed protein product [Caenorhabditis angaria]